MVNHEQLTARGLRAYELGRLRLALRIAVVLLPAGLLCATETGAEEGCACLTVLLVGLATYLRWHGRTGTRAVATGILAGSVPLAIGLATARLAPHSASALPTLLLASGSLLAGSWLAWRAGTAAHGLAAMAVAFLAACLGQLNAGGWAIGAAAAGLLTGAGLAAVIRYVQR